MTKQLSKILFVVLLLAVGLPPTTVFAAPSSSVVINELQLDGQTSKYEEFVELAVIGTEPVTLNGWTLKVKNISGSECTVAKPFSLTLTDVTLAPTDTFLIASQKDATTMYFSDLLPDMYYLPCSGSASVLAAEKVISLYDSNNVLVDEVYFSNLVTYTSFSPISYDYVAQKGVSFERIIDPLSGKPVDTDNSLQDFRPLAMPTPGALATLPDPVEPPLVDPVTVLPVEPVVNPLDPAPIPDPVPPLDPLVTETPVVTNTAPTYLPILINELFIDPVSPQTDSQDEWVELYNPNDTAQDLSGYTIYTGETFSYHHTFAAGVSIPAYGYVVATSGDTSLALANGAGAAKIVGPNNVVYDTTTYESAPAGESWAKDTDGIFKWTTTTTYGAQNSIFIPVPVVIEKAVATVKKTTKASTVTKVAGATTPKVTSTKVTATKTTKAATAKEAVDGAALVSAPSPLPIWLLAVLGILAVLYSVYEYRFELANKVYQFRQYRAGRQNNRR